MAAPATMSQTSLPSQWGPMEFTVMRRSNIDRDTNECRSDPEVNTSSTKNPNPETAMMKNQKNVRCMPAWYREPESFARRFVR